MTDQPVTIERNEPVDTEALSAFQPCPVCSSAKVVRLVAEWADGRPIPIVGCGNPWHYVGLPEAP